MKSVDQMPLKKNAVFWNSVASVLNSFQSAIILAVISHFGNAYDAGIFIFAYAVSNLMVVIGKFGMRPFQISDTSNKYSFSEYLFSRKVTTAAMLIISTGFSLYSGRESFAKFSTVLLWCLIRSIESYEDVYHGFLQKAEQLDKAAKVLSFRTFVSIIIFSVTYYCCNNLFIASLASLLISLFLALILNLNYRHLYPRSTSVNKHQVRCLLTENISIFVGYFCTMYLGNAPKYSINDVLSPETQAIFGYMFMPVFLTNMLCNFILQPLLTTYSEFWYQKNINGLKKLICQHLMVIVGLTVAIILGGKFIGIYLLEIIYNVSLQPYSHILYILLIASGLIAVLAYSKTLLTIVRRQTSILAGYLAACLAMFIGGPFALKAGNMTGISIYYMVILLLLDIFSFLLLINAFHKAQK